MPDEDPKVREISNRIRSIDWSAVDKRIDDGTEEAPKVKTDCPIKGLEQHANSSKAPLEPPRSRAGCWHTTTGKPRSFTKP